MLFLRQSTASQEILLGPFVDDTDGKTAETGLSIANTDIKIWAEGATSEFSKTSGGATHIASGRYYAVLDATDTATVGKMEVNVHVSGALPVRREFMVLEEAVYDQLFAASATGYQVPIWSSAGATVSLSATTVATVTNLTNAATSGDLTATMKASINTEADTALSDYGALKPTTAGRTLDVSAGGEAGIDWANVGSPTTTVNLSGTTVKTATDVASALTTVDDFLDTEIAAIKAKTDTIPTWPTNFSTLDIDGSGQVLVGGMDADVIGASQLSSLAIAEIQNGLATASALTTIDDFLDTEVAAIKSVTDKLDTALELDGAVYRLTTNALEQSPSGGGSADWTSDEKTVIRAVLGIPGSGTTPADPSTGILDTIRDSVLAVETDTQDIQSRIPAALVSGRIDASVGAMATNTLTASALATDAVAEIQSGLATAAALTVVDDFLDTEIAAIKAKTDTIPTWPTNFSSLDIDGSGQVLVGGMDADVIGASQLSSLAIAEIQNGLATAAALTTIDDFLDTEIAAIKAKTDNLPSDPADASDIASSFGVVADRFDDIENGMAGISAITDKLDTALELDGAVYRYTVNALEQAPSGGGGSADWTSDERTAIRAILGIPGSGTTPADPSAGILDTIRDSVLTVDDFLDTEVAAIKAKTDTIPNWPANFAALDIDGSGQVVVGGMDADVIGASQLSSLAIAEIQNGLATAAALTVVDDFLDTEVAAIKAVTDKLDTALELDGAVYRYTVNALEQAPSGGGGSTDWTSDERTAIRSILGIPGSGTTPTDPSVGILDTIRDRLPATLVSGRIDASVGAMAANTLTASALATDAVTEIQSGLATASTLATVAGYLDTEIAAILAIAAKLDTMLELDGAVYRLSVNALEQAPAGGGGGGTDWSSDERTAIRSILGIPGSGATPADPTVGILDTIRDSVGSLRYTGTSSTAIVPGPGTFELRANDLSGETGLTVRLYAEGGTAVANGAGGDVLAETASSDGHFTAAIAESLSGRHDYYVYRSGVAIYQGKVFCDGSTWTADAETVFGNVDTGARTVLTTVTAASLAVENATVRVTKGTETHAKQTNASGQATFNLDDGTWTVAITSPNATFAGASLVVDGNETPTYAMTVISVPSSTLPNATTGYLYCYDKTNVIQTDVQVCVQMIAGPGVSGYSYDSPVRKSSSGVDGLVSFTDLVRGATYRIWRGYTGQSDDSATFVVPASGASFALPELL